MIPARVKRAVLARQKYLCACGCGTDLQALQRAAKSGLYAGCERKLRGGRPAVLEFDHIVPRHEAEYRDGVLCVFHEGVWMERDDPRNLQALAAKCHAAKCEAERGEYPQAAPAVFSGIRTKPQAAYAGANKALRLRGKAPSKRYGG